MSEEYLTPHEISKILKVSKEFVYKHANEYGGVKIGKRLLRFSKEIFDKIMEVKKGACLQAQGEMDVRLLEKRGEVQEGRLPGQTRSDRSRSQDKKYSQSDKYGFREIMRKSIG